MRYHRLRTAEYGADQSFYHGKAGGMGTQKTKTLLTERRRKMRTQGWDRKVRWLCTTAVLMALNVLSCSFSIPVPGGHLYLIDAVIVTAALLMDPAGAFMVGGVGAFLGDLIFYPLPVVMLVSLISHGAQALVISLAARHPLGGRQKLTSAGGVIAGGLLMVGGYTVGRAFFYGTPATAVIKLPYEILQAGLGGVIGLLLVYRLKLGDKLRFRS